jgi:hypothetical protein
MNRAMNSFEFSLIARAKEPLRGQGMLVRHCVLCGQKPDVIMGLPEQHFCLREIWYCGFQTR